MTYEQEFLKDFEAWVKTQVTINEMALEESQKVYEEDKDERAKEAAIRYESRLDAYQFLLGKFANYQEGKGFHDLLDGLFGQRNY
ncbi:DUF1912 family protein [Streptococcus anginosus]|uniref:DUF1912 family protein n=1 Tax=Streptococcus anginosus TaxID=1328 RepID=UPI00066A7645|nr:DUF1912 family protein [Streptococcus anginosus]